MHTLSKVSVSVIPSATITFLLLLFMVSLVFMGPTPTVVEPVPSFAKIYHKDKPVEPIKDEKRAEKPVEPAEQPKTVDMPDPKPVIGGPGIITADVPMVSNPRKPGAVDTDYIPVYVPQPRYPNRAISRGVEGYAVVSLTITETGSTSDTKVLEEFPQNYGFGRAALKAAEKMKYNPRVVDGVPMEVPGITYKFSFEVEK